MLTFPTTTKRSDMTTDQQAEAVMLRAIIAALAKEYEVMANMFCKVPVRNEAYLAAMDAIK